MIASASVLRFAFRHWRAVLSSLALLCVALMLASARQEARHWHKQADRFAALYQGEQEAHRRTIADYRRAAELARARDAANAARVERDQAQISQEVSNDYQARIAALRARHDALRLQRGAAAPAADPSGGGAAHLPQAAESAGRAAAPAGEEGLSLELADEWRLTCSLQAEQLDALIDWVERQGALEEGPMPPG